jgi:restriction endonuclease S subunit
VCFHFLNGGNRGILSHSRCFRTLQPGINFEKSNNHQPKKGEILFSKDATPGLAYFLNEEPPKMIPSGGILRLKPKDKRVKPSYLTLVLNSLIVQEQIDRDVGGSVILHWRPDQVEKTLIPILEDDKQDIIQQKIAESFSLRKQSKHMLECAKKAVEMAIEQDEETAMQWLESQVGII